jgi:hypothetical protein
MKRYNVDRCSFRSTDHWNLEPEAFGEEELDVKNWNVSGNISYVGS